jgi:uncharacterized membrane-anchored protein YhcB (DUF1043 family)
MRGRYFYAIALVFLLLTGLIGHKAYKDAEKRQEKIENYQRQLEELKNDICVVQRFRLTLSMSKELATKFVSGCHHSVLAHNLGNAKTQAKKDLVVKLLGKPGSLEFEQVQDFCYGLFMHSTGYEKTQLDSERIFDDIVSKCK